MQKVMKRYIKKLSVVLTVLFMLGITGGVNLQHSLAKEKNKTNTDASIGYVDIQKILAHYPDVQLVFNTLQQTKQELQNDFATNAKNMPEEEKAAYANKLQQQIIQKENELFKPIEEKIMTAISDVAEKKGVSAVVDDKFVISGGVDLTDDVIKKIVGR